MSKVVDERIEKTQQRIYSETLLGVLAFLLGAIIYKQVVLQADLVAYVVELIAFFGAILYLNVRMWYTGTLFNSSKPPKSASLWKSSLIYAVVTTVFVVITNIGQYRGVGKSILMIVISLVVLMVTHLALIRLMIRLGKKRVDELETKYDE